MRKGIWKVLPPVIAAVLLAGTTAAFAATLPDVAGTPYETAVSTLAEKGILTGDVDGKFHPDDNLTRAQFCSVVARAMGAAAADINGTATQNVKKSGFPDLSGYEWAQGAIAYAAEKGVVTGYPDGNFSPGGNVTVNELITMTLRAAGYKDDALGGAWPANYLAKAGEIGALEGIAAPLPEYATKWMAAQLVFNCLGLIEEANKPAGTPGETAEAPSVISGASLSFVTGKFDADISSFDGKELSSSVRVFTYGLEKDYNQETRPPANGEYIEQTVYKYRNTETPAWYETDGGKITKLILPRDVGYTGMAYVVINGFTKTIGADGARIDGFVTLTAGREITWGGTSGAGELPSRYTTGELFELRIKNGEVTEVAAVDGSFAGRAPKGKFAEEIGTEKAFAALYEYTTGVATLTDENGERGKAYSVKSTPTIYLLEDDGTYSSVGPGSLGKNSFVRLYDVSNDRSEAADVVIVRR